MGVIVAVFVAEEELEVVTGVGRTVVNTSVVPGSVGGKVGAVVTFVEEVVTESFKVVVLDSVEVGV